LTGKVDDEAEETSKKGTWKDRKKGLQQNAQKGVGMQWIYTPRGRERKLRDLLPGCKHPVLRLFRLVGR
jgi:hypothetical protein